MQVVLLLDVGMVSTGPLAAFAVVTAEDGGQLLLGHPVGRKRDGALLCQAPTVLQTMSHRTEDISTTTFTNPDSEMAAYTDKMIFFSKIVKPYT